MSDVLPEMGESTDSPDSFSGQPQGQAMARYTIHVPATDNNRQDIPHVLDTARRALGDAGFQGRTVIRHAEGDWQGDEQNYDVEDMELIMVDAPDDPRSEEAVIGVAQLIKAMADQEAVYVTKQAITTYLI